MSDVKQQQQEQVTLDALRMGEIHTEILMKLFTSQLALIDLFLEFAARQTKTSYDQLHKIYMQKKDNYREQTIDALFAEFGVMDMRDIGKTKKEDGNEQENTGPKAEG